MNYSFFSKEKMIQISVWLACANSIAYYTLQQKKNKPLEKKILQFLTDFCITDKNPQKKDLTTMRAASCEIFCDS